MSISAQKQTILKDTYPNERIILYDFEIQNYHDFSLYMTTFSSSKLLERYADRPSRQKS